LSILEKGSEEYNAKLIEIENLRTEIRQKAKEDKEKKAKEEIELYDKTLEALKSRLAIEQELVKARLDATKQLINELKTSTDASVKEIEELADNALKSVEDKSLSFETRQQILDAYLESGYISQKKYAKFEIDLEKEKAESKLQILAAISNGLNSVGALVGEQTAAGKALGVASATIDTYVGATKAYAQGGALGFISAAAVIAAGLANVKRILSVQIPGGGAGGPTPSMPSAPRIPQNFSGTSINQSNPIPTTQLNVKDSRVYVVETDITNSQNKVKGIVRKATIR
jgi:hypothetical protein